MRKNYFLLMLLMFLPLYCLAGDDLVFYCDNTDWDKIVANDGKSLKVTVIPNRSQAIGKYSGTWNADEWNTMVLPFDIKPSEISRAFGYAVVNVVNPAKTTASNVAFQLKMSGTIPANTPFTIKTDEDIPVGKAIVFDKNGRGTAGQKRKIVAPTSSVVGVNAGQGYQFVGCYETQTIDKNHPAYHFLVNGGWKHIGASSSNTYDIIPFNAYVDQTAVSSVRAEDVTFTFEEEDGSTTTIKAIEYLNGRSTKADGWCTIDGRMLNGAPTEKGIYIRNGKKVVIK